MSFPLSLPIPEKNQERFSKKQADKFMIQIFSFFNPKGTNSHQPLYQVHLPNGVLEPFALKTLLILCGIKSIKGAENILQRFWSVLTWENHTVACHANVSLQPHHKMLYWIEIWSLYKIFKKPELCHTHTILQEAARR